MSELSSALSAASEAEAAPLSLGQELGRIVRLAAPIALAQIGLMTLALVDTAIVGKASVDDLAGSALGRSITFLCVAAGMGIPISLEAFATQALGASEPDTAWAALRSVLRASFVASVPIFVLSLLITMALVPLGVEPAVAHRARMFVWGYLPGAYGFLLFLSAKTFLQSHGKTMPALVAALIANGFNIVVCNVLVRGDAALATVGLGPMGLPKLGSFGAGLAAGLASLVLGAITYVSAAKLKPRHTVAALPMLSVVRLGLPIGLQLLAEVGVFSVVALVAGRLGSRVVSAHQIAISLASTTFMVALGISGAAAVRVGGAVGAGRSPRRIGFLATGLGVAMMAVGALLFLAIPEALVEPFTDDAEVKAIAIQLLRIAAMFQLFDATQGVLAGALRGAGDVRFPFIVMIVGYWAVGFPTALALGFALHWGAPGLWWGLSLGLLCVAVALFARFTWLTAKPIARVSR